MHLNAHNGLFHQLSCWWLSVVEATFKKKSIDFWLRGLRLRSGRNMFLLIFGSFEALKAI